MKTCPETRRKISADMSRDQEEDWCIFILRIVGDLLTIIMKINSCNKHGDRKSVV